MRSTVPSIWRSGLRTQSPTLKGRSRYSIIAPKKLASISFAAIPTIKPPTPPKVSTPDKLKPRFCIITKPPMTITIKRSILEIALMVVVSFALGNMPASTLLIRRNSIQTRVQTTIKWRTTARKVVG